MAEPFTLELEERRRGRAGFITFELLKPNNTFSESLLKEFIAFLASVCEKADGFILRSAHPKFFSNGLDGASMLGADREGRRGAVTTMIRFFSELLRFPRPLIVEINGHAMAGGAAMAVAADYRYMNGRAGRIGFSELAMGLPLPLCFILGIRSLVVPAAVRPLMEGRACRPTEALEMGLIDGVADSAEEVHRLALKRLDEILRLDQNAYLATRALQRSLLFDEIQKVMAEDIRQAENLVGEPFFEAALQNIAGRN